MRMNVVARWRCSGFLYNRPAREHPFGVGRVDSLGKGFGWLIEAFDRPDAGQRVSGPNA
jgi:hypothetical protein